MSARPRPPSMRYAPYSTKGGALGRAEKTVALSRSLVPAACMCCPPEVVRAMWGMDAWKKARAYSTCNKTALNRNYE